MRIHDLALGPILTLAGTIIFWKASTFPIPVGQPYGPGLFPMLIASGLILCGISLGVSGWCKRGQEPWIRLPGWVGSPRPSGAFFLSLAAVIFYITQVDTLGFIPTVFAILMALMGWLRRRYLSSFVLAVGATIATYAAFHYLLSVPLPAGMLRSLTG